MDFGGVYTAVLTPFEPGGGAIDFRAYSAMLERQVAAGVRGVVPCGTTGESPTLSHEEHRELIRRTVEIVKGRVKVIAGTGSNSTREAIDLTESACRDGADAVMLVNPYYNKPTQEGLYQHFKAIAQKATVPVIVYNIKGRTAVNVEPETFARLLDVPNIKAVKEASADLFQMARIQKLCGHRMDLLCGDDNLTPAVMGIGGKGVISVISNLYPKTMVRMVACFAKGDFPAGNEIFYRLLDLMNAMFWETNPIPVKAGAALLGLCDPEMRLPMVPLSDDKKAKLKTVMDAFGADQ
ncbi:MAG: 4-hydroxy-tetrahydrodipicolinate synthase [Spirochaetia bacterium]|nr:4-hydroxy-tetrahydrodipicolinate synthase [Spirochaetia bacterium]